MSREVSVQELRDRTDLVLAAVQAGERLTLTSDGKPVAEIVPCSARRSPWVPAAELHRIRRDAPADAELLADLREVGGHPGHMRVRGC